ncbi:MAG: class I tRNA ligase family protein, partial [Motiliproteus sp.]|nr:class I tRNA ligase family protein [Motiliproteus sp.]
GIDTQVMIDRYGADTVRLFMMFAAPPEQSLEWSDSGVEGAHRYLRRLWKLVFDHTQAGPVEALDTSALNDKQQEFRRKTHETISKVSDDIERRQTFNTAIAAVMELTNTISRFIDVSPQGRAVVQEALQAATLLLSPITPHICHEMWKALGQEDDSLTAPWPQLDESALVRDSIEMVVQVNGKLRGKIDVPADADRDHVQQVALANENVTRFTEGKTIRKVIVVPQKLVNIVVSG